MPRRALSDPLPANVRAERKSKRLGIFAGIVLGAPLVGAVVLGLVMALADVLGVYGVAVSPLQALALMVWHAIGVFALVVIIRAARFK